MSERKSDDKLIPITVLTGFLGSGKTTFVNYLMKEKHGYKIAIIENEFGEVGVDGDLVVQTGEEVIEMLNGCICCTVRDDLITALKRLHKEKLKHFDYVVIETTGMADPAPVAQTFFVDEDLKKMFYLDAIITFVDCKSTPTHLKEVKAEGAENEAVEQVAFADVLVLNKLDLVNATELEALKKELKAINGTAKMIEAKHSVVPLNQVLCIKAFDLQKTLEKEDNFLDLDAEHNHDKSVSSVGFVIEGSFHVDKFDKWLNNFLKNKSADVYRSKGIFYIMGSDERYVFQAVHMLLSMGSSSEMGMTFPPLGPNEKRVNKMCFIGKNLDRQELYNGLLACVHDGKVIEPGVKPKRKLRFAVGTRVSCNVGSWKIGKVVAHWYREMYWDTGRYAPYQVQLEEDDHLIYVPEDIKSLVRAAPVEQDPTEVVSSAKNSKKVVSRAKKSKKNKN